MNQVTEMPRLFDAVRIDDALARLDSLFAIMLRQPGFLRAEVLRSLDDPRRLLVLHAWRDLADWQRFQVSDTKIAFTNARPVALYEFLPCPMNWLAPKDTGEPFTPILRRELVRADRLDALNGNGVVSSTTYVYQDDAPEFQRRCDAPHALRRTATQFDARRRRSSRTRRSSRCCSAPRRSTQQHRRTDSSPRS